MSFSDAAERNKGPILAVLLQALPGPAPLRVLEIGSGTGQHAVYFAAHMPHLDWYTSDLADAHPVIAARTAAAALPNLHPPLMLDVRHFPQLGEFDAVYTANTAHIMPADAVPAMFAGVAGILRPGGRFLLYGPVNREGSFTSDSNRRFDAGLRARDPEMGLRDDRDLDRYAIAGHMERVADHAMPANNRLMIWEKSVRRRP